MRGGVEGADEDPGEEPPQALVSDGPHANRDNHLHHIPHRCLTVPQPGDSPAETDTAKKVALTQ